MIKKLFGQTEEEQMAYIKKKLIITLVIIVVGTLVGIFGYNDAFVGGIGIAFYVWGWNAMRAIFGASVFAALFSRNIVIGVLILIAFMLVGYIAGIFCFSVGLCRFVQIIAKNHKKISEETAEK